MSEENVELTRLACERFNRGDRAGFQRMMARDVEVVPLRAALEGTVYRGPNALAEFWADTDEAWEELGLEVEEIRDCGDHVLLIGRLRGRGRETGAEVDSRMGWVLSFDAGRIARLRTYPSVPEAIEAAGLRE